MLRMGIIGIGNMGKGHAKNILGGNIPGLQLTAVCDTDSDKLAQARGLFGDSIRYFETPDEFYSNSNLIDAVLIATPHYDHPQLAIRGFEQGLHVLVEKPAGVYTKQVREMNDTAEKSGKVFGIMYNQRTNPVYQRVRDLVQSGQLGTMKRMVWIITDWYRPQAYHDSSDWRSTWALEGGGVLLNQDPHQLDLWQWMVGMPKRIRSFAYYGKHYDIEVEDDVNVFAEYDNGMLANFITTTGETPGTNRLELSGSMGKLVVENDKLTFSRNCMDEREFNAKWDAKWENTNWQATWSGVMGRPEVWTCDIPVSTENPQHTGILKDFVDVIQSGKTSANLLAPGAEGINGLMISNAIHLSSWTDQWVQPQNLDEDLFYTMLQDKIRNIK